MSSVMCNDVTTIEGKTLYKYKVRSVVLSTTSNVMLYLFTRTNLFTLCCICLLGQTFLRYAVFVY